MVMFLMFNTKNRLVFLSEMLEHPNGYNVCSIGSNVSQPDNSRLSHADTCYVGADSVIRVKYGSGRLKRKTTSGHNDSLLIMEDMEQRMLLLFGSHKGNSTGYNGSHTGTCVLISSVGSALHCASQLTTGSGENRR